MSSINIRKCRSEDLESLIPLWHQSKKRAFPYVEVQQKYTVEDDRNYFLSTVVPSCGVWVAEIGDKLVGFMALEDDLIDLLFVDIEGQRQGIGTALVGETTPRDAPCHHYPGMGARAVGSMRPAIRLFAGNYVEMMWSAQAELAQPERSSGRDCPGGASTEMELGSVN